MQVGEKEKPHEHKERTEEEKRTCYILRNNTDTLKGGKKEME